MLTCVKHFLLPFLHLQGTLQGLVVAYRINLKLKKLFPFEDQSSEPSLLVREKTASSASHSADLSSIVYSPTPMSKTIHNYTKGSGVGDFRVESGLFTEFVFRKPTMHRKTVPSKTQSGYLYFITTYSVHLLHVLFDNVVCIQMQDAALFSILSSHR